ncbi:hypothetical protein [Nonlabens xiamenensis]|uniref:hypothetical protein n=1 Tax=Nonlabens xiamenensis TaxID=2341043 RepID=UPI000F6129A9|nr:hypothetical protein [Nonlabens xiamenensis]
MIALDLTYMLETEWYWAFPAAGKQNQVIVISKFLEYQPGIMQAKSFSLETIRGITPFSAPKPYTMLEFQLGPQSPTLQQLQAVRDRWPHAELIAQSFDKGHLSVRIQTDLEQTKISGELPRMDLTKLPLHHWRYRQKIGMDQAQLMIRALKEGVLLIKMAGAFDVQGVLPKLPVTWTFDPVEIIHHLEDLRKSTEGFESQEITRLVQREELPLQTEMMGEVDPIVLADALTHYLLTHYAVPVPLGKQPAGALLEWKDNLTDIGQQTIDLRHNHPVRRLFYLSLQMLEEIKKELNLHGIEQLVTTTIVDPIPTGFQRLEINHPFYSIPKSVLQIGVKLTAAPVLPWRPQAITETLIFERKNQHVYAVLKFSASEDLAYELEPFVILKTKNTSQRLTGTKRSLTSKEVHLDITDFPFESINISCAPSLFELGDVNLSLANQQETIIESIGLDQEEPYLSLGYLPQDQEKYYLQVHITNTTTGLEATTELDGSADRHLTLADFPAYGFQKLDIHLDFMDTKTPVVLELVSTGKPKSQEHITTLVFTPEKSRQQWEWFSDRIDQAGYQYRRLGAHTQLSRPEGSNTTDWSEPLDYTQHHLTLTV